MKQVKALANGAIEKVRQQKELFEAETTWFHVFKALIDNGDLAKMGPYAFTTYCVIKSYTNFATGRAFPAIETIVAKSGISERQIKKELQTLEQLGYITKTKKGRHNEYTLREKVQITDGQGRPQAEATWDYLPSSVREAVADLKNVLITGDFAGAKIVQINTLHVQINQGDNNVNIQITEEQMSKLPPEMRKTLESLKQNMAVRKNKE